MFVHGVGKASIRMEHPTFNCGNRRRFKYVYYSKVNAGGDWVCDDCITLWLVPSIFPPTTSHYGSTRLANKVLQAERALTSPARHPVQQPSAEWSRLIYCKNLVKANNQRPHGLKALFGRKIAMTPIETEAAKGRGKEVVQCGVAITAPDMPGVNACIHLRCGSCQGTTCSNCALPTYKESSHICRGSTLRDSK